MSDERNQWATRTDMGKSMSGVDEDCVEERAEIRDSEAASAGADSGAGGRTSG